VDLSTCDHAGISAMEDFIKAVEKERGAKIPEADADSLIAAAQDILARLGGA